MPNSFRIVYSSKVYRFKEIANLDVVNEENDYQKVPRTSLSNIVTGNSCGQARVHCNNERRRGSRLFGFS